MVRHNRGALSIKGCCLNSKGKDLLKGDKTGEFVEVLVHDTQVAGCAVTHRVVDADGGSHQEVLYTFKENLPDGCRSVVIRSGVGEPQYANKVLTVYVGQSGTGRWNLNNDQELFQVLNPQGQVADERRFNGNHCKQASDHVKSPVAVPPVVPVTPSIPPARHFGKPRF